MRFRKTLMKALFEDYGLAIWLLLLSMIGVVLVFGIVTLAVSIAEMALIVGLGLTPGLIASKFIGVALIGGGIVFTLYDFVRALIKETHKRIEDENLETMAALKGETYNPYWREAEQRIARIRHVRGSGGTRESM